MEWNTKAGQREGNASRRVTRNVQQAGTDGRKLHLRGGSHNNGPEGNLAPAPLNAGKTSDRQQDIDCPNMIQVHPSVAPLLQRLVLREGSEYSVVGRVSGCWLQPRWRRTLMSQCWWVGSQVKPSSLAAFALMIVLGLEQFWRVGRQCVRETAMYTVRVRGCQRGPRLPLTLRPPSNTGMCQG